MATVAPDAEDRGARAPGLVAGALRWVGRGGLGGGGAPVLRLPGKSAGGSYKRVAPVTLPRLGSGEGAVSAGGKAGLAPSSAGSSSLLSLGTGLAGSPRQGALAGKGDASSLLARLRHGVTVLASSDGPVVRFSPAPSLARLPAGDDEDGVGVASGEAAGAGSKRASHVQDCTCPPCRRARRAARTRPVTLRYKASIPLIDATMEHNGLRRTSRDDWSVLWVSGALNQSVFSSLRKSQWVNQFPRTYEITRKDKLCRNMMRMQEEHGAKHFSFYPKTYVLPEHRIEFEEEVSRQLNEAATESLYGGGGASGPTSGPTSGPASGPASGLGEGPAEAEAEAEAGAAGEAAGDPQAPTQAQAQAQAAAPPRLWIVKPAASACGRGIYVTDNPGEVPLGGLEDSNVTVSEYIANPLLLDGRKFDLRIYAAVTSFAPLTVYVYKEGLVRLATVQYSADAASLANRLVHLTNYAVQKHSEAFEAPPPLRRGGGAGELASAEAETLAQAQGAARTTDEAARGAPSANQEDSEASSKWSLSTFRARLARMGIDAEALFAKIDSIVVKTLISIEAQVQLAMTMACRHPQQCFQLFGFDVLIDHKLKPWLLEVNLGPSLSCDHDLDLAIKSEMVADLLTLAGVRPADLRARNGVPEDPPPVARAADPADLPPPTPQQLQRMVRRLREEQARAGGWRCVYPTPEAFVFDRFFARKGVSQWLAEHLSQGRSESYKSRVRKLSRSKSSA